MNSECFCFLHDPSEHRSNVYVLWNCSCATEYLDPPMNAKQVPSCLWLVLSPEKHLVIQNWGMPPIDLFKLAPWVRCHVLSAPLLAVSSTSGAQAKPGCPYLFTPLSSARPGSLAGRTSYLCLQNVSCFPQDLFTTLIYPGACPIWSTICSHALHLPVWFQQEMGGRKERKVWVYSCGALPVRLPQDGSVTCCESQENISIRGSPLSWSNNSLSFPLQASGW